MIKINNRLRPFSLKILRSTSALAMAIALSSLVLLSSCQGKAPRNRAGAPGDTLSAQGGKGNNDAIPVETAPVEKRTVSSYVVATSTLEAESTAQLLAETTGRVIEICSEEGDGVSKGQVLVKLEDTQQKLDFEKAAIDLEVAEKDWKRAEELEKKGIVSSKEFDEARARWETARHAKARAEYELEKTTISAPFSGLVTERNVQLGETVTPGKHVATVSDFDPLVVKFRVPETEIGAVRPGHPVIIEFLSEGTPARHAIVSLVSPVIDQGTGTVKLTAHLQNPGFQIKPGTFVRARVIVATHSSALTIPKKALMSEDTVHHVFTVASDTTARVEVLPGITDGQNIEILSGLSIGDEVVTVGQSGLKSGEKVKIVTTPQPK